MANHTPPIESYSIAQAADETGLTPKAIARRIERDQSRPADSRKLGATKVEGQWRLPAATVKALRRERIRETGKPPAPPPPSSRSITVSETDLQTLINRAVADALPRLLQTAEAAERERAERARADAAERRVAELEAELARARDSQDQHFVSWGWLGRIFGSGSDREAQAPAASLPPAPDREAESTR